MLAFAPLARSQSSCRALSLVVTALLAVILGGAGLARLTSPAGPAAERAPLELTLRGLSAENVARADRILAQPLPARPTPATAAREPEPREPSISEAPGFAATLTSPSDLPPVLAPIASPIRPRATGWQAEFIQAVGMAARRSYASAWIPPSVTISQAILESDWGRSDLAQRGHNYFGIKAFGRPGSAGVLSYPTPEYEDGRTVWIEAQFRAYHSLPDSVADYHRFLLENPRYRLALNQGHDVEGFVRGLVRAGYATDPAYGSKLFQFMDQYDLYRYDRA